MAGCTPEISIDIYAAERVAGTTVDVREHMEYAYGHVPGAVWIPMGQLPSRLGELDPSKPVHVICATGNRSRAMADLLRGRRLRRRLGRDRHRRLGRGRSPGGGGSVTPTLSRRAVGPGRADS
jgi:hypothetical protein